MIIRLALDGDAEQIAALYAPVVRDTTISFELVPPTVGEMQQRVASVLAGDRPWLVLDAGGEVLGYAYAGEYRPRDAYRWAVESSICIGPGVRSRGFGLRLYDCLLSLLALQGFHSVYAAIALPNAASVALHRSVGFDRAGVLRHAGFKHGAWRDVEWWQRQLPGAPVPPPSPRSLADAQRSRAWVETLARVNGSLVMCSDA